MHSQKYILLTVNNQYRTVSGFFLILKHNLTNTDHENNEIIICFSLITNILFF